MRKRVRGAGREGAEQIVVAVAVAGVEAPRGKVGRQPPRQRASGSIGSADGRAAAGVALMRHAEQQNKADECRDA